MSINQCVQIFYLFKKQPSMVCCKLKISLMILLYERVNFDSNTRMTGNYDLENVLVGENRNLPSVQKLLL